MSAAWAEITTLDHGHGGPGWELGRCLWSPMTSKDGANRYGVMRLPMPDDEVFHLVAGVSATNPKQRFLYGQSRVKQAFSVETSEPPSPGPWKGAGSFFRIALTGFKESSPKYAMDAIESGLEEIILSDLLSRPKYYPYSSYRDEFRGSQGIYLARLTPSLIAALHLFTDKSMGASKADAPEAVTEVAREYAEGERSLREQLLFKRNPALREAAIKKHGLRCHACNLNFADVYGALGEGYIEIHHLNPLSERQDSIRGTQTTRIDDVVPLCANCHRMIHRKRPALSLDELALALSRSSEVATRPHMSRI